MRPSHFKSLLVLLAASAFAVFLGYALANGNFEILLLLCTVALGTYLVVMPGYIPLIALGLMSPITLPIPFIYKFPMMLLVIGICLLKYGLRRGLLHHQRGPFRHSLTLTFALFFGWVALRYCHDPVLPNIAGFGANVTGFRSYLDYGICGALILLLGLFLPERRDIVNQIRWLGIISVFFILFLVPLVFTKSFQVAVFLSRLGLFVTFFDNGLLRFVVLPGFGLLLVSLALLPNLIKTSLRWRILIGLLGTVAIIMGGNRGSLVMAFVLVLSMALARRRLKTFSGIAAGIVALLLAFTYIGENVRMTEGYGFLRVLSLTSRRIAVNTDAAANMEWRMVRWRRALEGIKDNPILGKGYGGLERAFLFTDYTQFEEARVDIDLASGGIHNGYLASAWSLGIPALVLFVIAFISQIYLRLRDSLRLRTSDPQMSDIHCFVFAHLMAFGPAIYIGTDLNNPMLWFLLSLGVLAGRIKQAEQFDASRAAKAESEFGGAGVAIPAAG